MKVKKIINIYFTEQEISAMIYKHLVNEGLEDLAKHMLNNEHFIEYSDDHYVVCIDGEMNDDIFTTKDVQEEFSEHKEGGTNITPKTKKMIDNLDKKIDIENVLSYDEYDDKYGKIIKNKTSSKKKERKWKKHL